MGTYEPHGENRVYIQTEEDQLIIKKKGQDAPVATHTLAQGKGKLVKNTNHSRDRTRGIQAYIDTVSEAYENTEIVHVFIEEMAKRYPRYVRDQLQIMHQTIHKFPGSAMQGLERCVAESRWSANDLRDTTVYLHQLETGNSQSNERIHFDQVTDQTIHSNEMARVRELDSYLDILGGDMK